MSQSISALHNQSSLVDKKAISDVAHLSQVPISDMCILDSEQQNAPLDKSSPRAIKGWRWALVVCAILNSLFLFALNNTIVADIQPAIVETFGDIGKLSWLGASGATTTSLVSNSL
jgi:hypothetical protein